ncbi:amino acid adenylation domain-containing protein [Streptomyces californicus]|uniref:amino acid adenylation domain-containing protein n=1 Tax=Streptomyces californicus TaxID=67351 RepID=UPI00296F3239|nr:amino acid adenylation domain-containing protein [Streptomyces californicus]MDW4918670.1 amino acid adenylation domain-containing protein [Streptomyces californicus]
MATTTHLSLWDRFDGTARRYPHHTALVADSTTLTYAALLHHAETLAARILEHGGTPRTVALLARRTPATYAAYLAIQRIGAAAVPLNPSAPRARNETVVRDSGSFLVLADAAHPAHAAGQAAPLLPVSLSDTAEPAATTLLTNTPPPGPQDTAYILFTSGSTGRPKGVVIQHANTHAYLQHAVARTGAGPDSRLSQTFDLTFDPSVFDMFVTWSTGAALVVPTRDELMDPAGFADRHQLTHWFSVPSVISLASRLRRLAPGSMPTLQYAAFAGEPLTLRQASALAAAAPGARLENLYGPTELTITCTGHRLPADTQDWPSTTNGTVPIGTPHPGADTLIVDDDLNPSLQGELLVRGTQRFPGYLDANDNHGRFLTGEPATGLTPYTGGNLPPTAWYRTGDRVAHHGTELVHLGRLDSQVKINGYRIELGEVEEALRSCDGVTEAVVIARTDRPTPALQAVYTGPATQTEPLLAALQKRLPDYMVPRTCLRLDQLPLNPNGKTDRAAVLAALDTNQHPTPAPAHTMERRERNPVT